MPLERVVVVHDELDLAFGTVRVKQGGGDGGHNGLRSVTSSLHGKDYLRVRVGIGRPPGRQDPADYVLKPFSAVERKELAWVVDRAADAAESLLTTGWPRRRTPITRDPAPADVPAGSASRPARRPTGGG